MTKEFSFSVKKDADGNLVVNAQEQMKSAQGKPLGQIGADISGSVSDPDKASLSSLFDSLKAVLEAQ